MGRYEDFNDREERDTKFRRWKERMGRFGILDMEVSENEIRGRDNDSGLHDVFVDPDNRLDGGVK